MWFPCNSIQLLTGRIILLVALQNTVKIMFLQNDSFRASQLNITSSLMTSQTSQFKSIRFITLGQWLSCFWWESEKTIKENNQPN